MTAYESTGPPSFLDKVCEIGEFVCSMFMIFILCTILHAKPLPQAYNNPDLSLIPNGDFPLIMITDEEKEDDYI